MPQPVPDSRYGYGRVARAFHWLTALLILSAVMIGLSMVRLPATSEDAVARVFRAFSLHKTIGIAAFFTALGRIGWALSHRHPGPLHPERRLETFTAGLTHWALYGAMLVMPLSGWLGHSASPGFAPILWPFGQSLPFVPVSEPLARMFDAVHRTSAWLLCGAVALHMLGAFKHAIVDMDATMSRMMSGLGTPVAAHTRDAGPALAALALWAATITTGIILTPPQPADVTAAGGSAASSDPFAEIDAAVARDSAGGGTGLPAWTVTGGTVGFSFRLQGYETSGSFTGWTADIRYDDAARSGTVTAGIPMSGLTLGALTDQALGPEIFDAAQFPRAEFAADLAPDGSAAGTLTLRGTAVPVMMPVSITVNGDIARAAGTLTLDRRDFGIGPGYADEKTLGFAVTVAIALTAHREAAAP